MIHVLLFVSTAALADPGRVYAGATAGAALDGRPVVRGSLDLGVAPGLTLAGEAGVTPSDATVALGCGALVSPVDGPWWRVGVYAGPELAVPWDRDPRPGWPVPLAPEGTALQVRAGVRASWLLFWGLALTARVDHVLPLAPDRGWNEAAAGLAVRL